MAYTTIRSRLPGLGLAALALSLILTACSNGNDDVVLVVQKPAAANPLVEGPVTNGGAADCCVITIFGIRVDLRDQGYVPGTPFYTFVKFIEEEGYRETEYFISGTATSYIATDELRSDGIWSVEAADAAPYKTRIVVLRPDNDADFNGTVVVEWFNVTGGLDAAPDWLPMHTELMREGYAWVGVSAQAVGVEGGGAFSLPLKAADPERYGSLSHPGDSFSYDIFSQAAQAVRNPIGLEPLEGLKVQRMIGVGQSQSAARLITYVNAIHPTVELFDGFVIHGRGLGSSALSQEPQVAVATPSPVELRGDLPQPIITLQAETDVLGRGGEAWRQPDAEFFRHWEVAGTAHADNYTTIKGVEDRGDDPGIADVVPNASVRPPFISCPLPVNDGPMHWVAKAAISALNRWISTGEAAAHAPYLTLTPDGTAFELDDLGNVKGGIRTPYVDAPTAVLSGLGQPANNSFCALYGTSELLDEATLQALYPDTTSYIDAVDASTDSAVGAGFLLPADAALIKARARTSGIGGL